MASRPASVVRPDAFSLPASAAWAAAAFAAAEAPFSQEAVCAVAGAHLAEEFATAERARDGSAPAGYSAQQADSARDDSAALTVDDQSAPAAQLVGLVPAAYLAQADSARDGPAGDGESAQADSARDGLVVPVGQSAQADSPRDGLVAPAGYSAGPDSSPQDARSEQAGCPAGSQAAYWRAGLVFRRSANSLAGCPVGPCSASPVSPEAPV